MQIRANFMSWPSWQQYLWSNMHQTVCNLANLVGNCIVQICLLQKLLSFWKTAIFLNNDIKSKTYWCILLLHIFKQHEIERMDRHHLSVADERLQSISSLLPNTTKHIKIIALKDYSLYYPPKTCLKGLSQFCVHFSP